MTEREEAFIAQAKIIQEILDFKQKLEVERDRTIGKCFSHIAISGVTSDPTFEKEMLNKEANPALVEKIGLCDRLITFCRTNPLSKENAAVTRFLFNNGCFRHYDELEKLEQKTRKIGYILIPLALIILLIVICCATTAKWFFLALFAFAPTTIISVAVIFLVIGALWYNKKESDTILAVQEYENGEKYAKQARSMNIYIS